MPRARPETVKKAGNREKAASQWSTLKSGPLAGSENGEKARKLEKSQKLHPTKKRPALPVAFDLFSRWPSLDDWLHLVLDEGVICDIRNDWYDIIFIFLVIWCEDIVDDLAG